MPPQQLMTLAIIGGVWTASSFVEALRTILNRIYKIHSPPHYIFRRTLSIIQFLFIVIFLFLGMMILVVLPIVLNNLFNLSMSVNHDLSRSVIHALNKMSFIWIYVRSILVYVFLFLSSSTLYYIIPNVKIKFKEVLPGASLVVVLWAISGRIFSKYITYYSQLDLVYGSLANIIITMIFFYVNNIIFIYGAEFNYHLSKGS
ncbi:ribonuclease BN [Candidatus Phycorickettsia trachydisci]|uniref:Ribonuclease BN n=1 Tax=Candidatus Phycorickettsia trachydisci TaxID=2115978 RepID=A0A2P1P896_9RICK|nr:ribonuclease BN [Candidatus Phycorickettsia trachydisci]